MRLSSTLSSEKQIRKRFPNPGSSQSELKGIKTLLERTGKRVGRNSKAAFFHEILTLNSEVVAKYIEKLVAQMQLATTLWFFRQSPLEIHGHLSPLVKLSVRQTPLTAAEHFK